MNERHPRTDAIDAISTLGEPVRRRLYEYVTAAHRAVGRDEAAAALGIGRPLAAFHLDRLVRDGLLVAEFRRLTGRSGPGAGRPSKLYRRASRDVAVSLPPRDYEIAADVFATALEDLAAGLPPPALLEAAKAYGRRLADEVRDAGEVRDADEVRDAGEVGDAGDAGPAPGAPAETDEADETDEAAADPGAEPLREAGPGSHKRLVDALSRLGFEPSEEGAIVRLRNCPFDALARDHRGLTCPANLALLESLVERLDTEARPVPMPEEGYCCVGIRLGGRRDPAAEPA